MQLLEEELKEKNDELESQNKILKSQLEAQINRSDFMEECIAELAVKVY